MEAVSIGVRNAHRTIICVGLKDFEGSRKDYPYFSKKIFADNLFERLKILTDDSELFVVLQGSIGTLNEFLIVWALKNSLKKNFRVCLAGNMHNSIKTCSFIPKKELHYIEFHNNLIEFKKSFD